MKVGGFGWQFSRVQTVPSIRQRVTPPSIAAQASAGLVGMQGGQNNQSARRSVRGIVVLQCYPTTSSAATASLTAQYETGRSKEGTGDTF